MHRIIRFLLFFVFLAPCFLFGQVQIDVPFEQRMSATPTYPEVIAFYADLAKASTTTDLREVGTTDSGHPLHVVVAATNPGLSLAKFSESGKTILLVNNAIHPGEPCGVDATMLLFRDLAEGGKLHHLLQEVIIVAIPFYNISGGLNRGPYSRANQEGPEEYGFRGNVKNLDLNRDFIKCDSKNAQSFNQLFTALDPDVFIDNHTSNGADYPYVLTMIATQKDKLAQPLAAFQTEQMLPALYGEMAEKGWEMTPYVNAATTPEEGIYGFLDLPRYSSGYAALRNSFGFTAEAHMLKPYADRVRSTYAFMETLLEFLQKEGKALHDLRKAVKAADQQRPIFDLDWKLNREQQDSILFRGYTAKTRPSAVSGQPRLYYDREAPYARYVPFFDAYEAQVRVSKPYAYLIPQAYDAVIERLLWNGVEIQRLERDTILEVEQYYIEDYKDKKAYEGHYLHYDVQVRSVLNRRQYLAGDYLVLANQSVNRYLLSVLEPHAPDSFFAWNFFDGILMQKEYFSAYVFEDLAEQLLEEQPELQTALDEKRRSDPEFAKNGRAQLDFIYQRSPYYEATHRLYPVGRLMQP